MSWIALGMAAMLSAQTPASRFSKPVLVHTQSDNFPYSFVDREGVAKGFSVDLVDAVAKQMDIPLARLVGLSGEVRSDLEGGRIDIIQNYTFDPAREEYAAFTSSVLELKGGVFVNKRKPPIRTVEDFRGRSIMLVGRKGPGERFARENMPGVNIVFVESGRDALLRLQAGEHDAAFLGLFTALPSIKEYELKDIVQLKLPLPEYSLRFCMAVRKDDNVLLNRLNEGLAIIRRTGEYDRIYEKWFGQISPRGVSREKVVLITICFLAVCLALALWGFLRQRQLRRRIAGQAGELAEGRELLAHAQSVAQIGHWRWQSGPPEAMTWSEETFRVFGRDLRMGAPATIEEFTRFSPAADDAAWREAIERARRESHSFEQEITIEPLPGKKKYLHLRTQSVILNGARSHAIFGTVQDITAWRQAELARQESQELLRALHENLPTAIGVLDEVERVWCLALLNPAAQQLTGVSRDSTELGALPLPPALTDEPAWRELLAQAETAAHPVSFEVQCTEKRRSFFVRLVPLRTRGKSRRCCFLIDDITERKSKDSEIAQSRRLRAIGEMVGGIAHEFNNLLTPILVKSDMLARDPAYNFSAELQADHRLIADTASRAADLTRRLLAFERKVDLRPEVIRLRAVVEANLDLLRHTADRRIRTEANVADALPSLYLNASDLSQIVLNLFINARDTLDDKLAQKKDTPWQPLITVDALCLAGDAAEPQDAGAHARPERWIKLSVSDNGQGIAPSEMERIFEPFYTTKQVGRGTGLGLATVWHLVVGLGGRIKVESTQGLGTTFSVFLPVNPAPNSPKIEPVARRAATGLRMLVVEDEDVVAITIQSLLKRDLHQVALARNGQEGWERFVQTPGGFDAILCDLNMPQVTGLELARRILGHEQRCPFIVMSGRITDATRDELETLGVTAILEKPFALAALREALAQVPRPTAAV